MLFIFIIATGIEVSFLILSNDYLVSFAIKFNSCLYGFVLCVIYRGLVGAKIFFSFSENILRGKHSNRFQFDTLHLGNSMSLVVLDVFGLQVTPIDHFLQL